MFFLITVLNIFPAHAHAHVHAGDARFVAASALARRLHLGTVGFTGPDRFTTGNGQHCRFENLYAINCQDACGNWTSHWADNGGFAQGAITTNEMGGPLARSCQ